MIAGATLIVSAALNLYNIDYQPRLLLASEAAVGAVLIGAGIVIHRRGHRPSNASPRSNEEL